MLKDGTLTYISLFSSAGVGCYGFKEKGFECIATNEFIQRRLDVQRFNNKCKFESGYIIGDIKKPQTKSQIFAEIDKYSHLGNDCVDVLIATPPCQGMSVANHKKAINEIDRNSLVVESILLTQKILPRFFVFENVQSFLTTGCTAPDKKIAPIGEVIDAELGADYEIIGRILNFKNYGSNSSRTRTLVIGVRNDYAEHISPLDLYPSFQKEKLLKDVIGKLPALSWGEISSHDIYHSFREYPREMECWIDGLAENMSAFDNLDPKKRPHKTVNGTIIENVQKNGDKYTRQSWNKVAPCIHTRNDQLASQNTIHPRDNRVFSIRELMLMMTIPTSFKWVRASTDELNCLSLTEKKHFLKTQAIKIRQSIGEAVPTIIFETIAANIKQTLKENLCKVNISQEIQNFNLGNAKNLINYISTNPCNYSTSILSKIAEMANGKRFDTDAYYTNKTLLNHIYNQMPKFSKESIRILEPSVGIGNFLPYIFKKYEAIAHITIDVIDIDSTSIQLLKLMLKKINVPKNVVINYINTDFLCFENSSKYDLVIGKPPFTKAKRSVHPEYFSTLYNTDTTNLSSMFLEHAIHIGDYVCMVLPKNVLNTEEFTKTRTLINNYRINSICDFGEKGFKGVLIETICISIKTTSRPNTTIIKNITKNIVNRCNQKSLTDSKYPYWLLYRNEFFDNIANTLTFNVFEVFRDRQITKKLLCSKEAPNSIRVLKSRNITKTGTVINIANYDSYIKKDVLQHLSVYNYFNDTNVFLAPNMTYYPRLIRNPKNCTVNGSLAILIPRNKSIDITMEQLNYFSSDEFRTFYQIARNYQTRSLNIDKTSVFFFGLKRADCNVKRK